MAYNNFCVAICTYLGVEVEEEGVFSEVTRLDEGVKVIKGGGEGFEGEKGGLLGSGR